MKYRKWMASTLALALAGTLLTAAGCSAPGQEGTSTASTAGMPAEKTVLICSTWIGYAPLHLAAEKGFFEEEGLDVDIRLIENGGDTKAAIIANQGQVLAQTLDTEVLAKSSGADIKEVLPLCDSNGGDGVVAKKEYHSLADLKGKTIAMDTTGTPSLFWFNMMLEEQNLSMEDFDIKNMPAGDAGAAFVAGKVDAAVTWEPWLSKANETGFGQTLYSSKDYPGVIVDTLAVRNDYAEQYPKAVQALIRAWFRAVEYAKENPDDANPIMAKSQGMSTEDFEEQLQNVRYYDEAYAEEYLCGGKMTEMAQKASDLWTEVNLMEEPVDAKTLVDASYLTAVLEESASSTSEA